MSSKRTNQESVGPWLNVLYKLVWQMQIRLRYSTLSLSLSLPVSPRPLCLETGSNSRETTGSGGGSSQGSLEKSHLYEFMGPAGPTSLTSLASYGASPFGSHFSAHEGEEGH